MDTSPDRITMARLRGAASRHAGWTEPTGEARQAAIAELRQIAAGRTDLLAEVAGVLLGCYPEGDTHHLQGRIMAELLIEAGADPAEVENWVRVGEERRGGPMPGPAPARPPAGMPRTGQQGR